MLTRVLVCGAGSIGRRHISNLKTLGAEVVVWRQRSDLAAELSNELGVAVFTSLSEAIKQVDAVVVATATDAHIDIAKDAAIQGKAIFLEKPISHNTDDVNEFKEIVQRNNLVVEVGCQLRAHPNLRHLYECIKQDQYGPLYTFRAVVGQRLDGWRPGTDYRHCYSSDASRGGGALFDLIHEIDLVHWLAGPIDRVYAHLVHLSDLEMNGEDLANLVLVTEAGAVGHVQLDMLSPSYRRGLELVFHDAVIFWDYLSGKLERKSSTDGQIINEVPKTFERNSLFLDHMRHFLERIKNSDIEPLCSLDDGIAVLCAAQAARLSNERRCEVALKEIII